MVLAAEGSDQVKVPMIGPRIMPPSIDQFPIRFMRGAKRFYVQVVQLNDRPVVIPVNVYSGLPSMSDAACREAIEHCAKSGDKAVVVVGTERKRFKRFEITVQHEVKTTIRVLKAEVRS